MRKFSAVLFLVAVTVCLSWSDLSACGDKFLLIGRGARFQRAYAAAHPASILVYTHQQSARAAAVRDPELLGSLKLAGHKVQTVEDQSKLQDLLKSGGYDIVIADFSDAATVEQHVRNATSKPAFVPVMYKPSKAESDAAQQQFACLLKAPDKISHSLGAIEDLMKARLNVAKVKG